MKNIFLFARNSFLGLLSALVFTTYALGQDQVYTVISVHKATQDGQALSLGNDVVQDKTITITEGGYLALADADGALYEFKESGSYKPSEGSFESPLVAFQTEQTGKAMSEKAKEEEEDLGTPDESQPPITIQLPTESFIYHKIVPIVWKFHHEDDGHKEEKVYDFTISDMFGDEIFKKSTNKDSYKLDLNNITGNEGVPEVWLCAVSLQETPHASDSYTIKPLDEEKRKEVDNDMQDLSKSYSSPLAHLVLAAYFESKDLPLDALIHYKKALRFSGDNEAVSHLFERFKENYKLY